MTFCQLWLAIRKKIYVILNKRYFVKKIRQTYFLLDIYNYIDRQIEAFNEYESEQVDFFIHSIKQYQCDYFLDIGAHWGYYSLLIANAIELSSINILAFEPDSINRNQFFANIFLNRLQEKIAVFDCALSDTESVSKFHHYNDENRGRSRVSEDGSINIKTNKADNLIAIKNERIAIKIDVEGHEINVINGMLSLLENNYCFIQVESFDSVHEKLHERFLYLNYKLVNKIGNDYYYTNSYP